MQPNPVVWFEIYVQDMKRARAFYEAVFAVRLDKMDNPTDDLSEMWAFPMRMDGAGAAGALVKMEGGPSGGNSVIVYIGCEDCAVEAKRVAPNGGTVMKEKFSIGQYGFISLVTDPEGNVIGLHSQK